MQVVAFLASVASLGGGLVAIFRGAFIAGFSIWIMLIAYDVAFGKSEDGLAYLLKKIFRIFIIGVIALYGFPQLFELLDSVKDGLLVALTGSPNISNILETNLINPMKSFFDTLVQWLITGITVWDLATPATLLWKVLYYLGLWLVFAVLVLVVVGVCVVSLSMFLVALTMFSLLMVVGPFFLLCLAFPFLQRFFETYIGAVMTACLAMAFTGMLVVVVGMLLNLAAIAGSLTTTTDYLAFRTIALLVAAKIGQALLVIYMFFKVFDLASALGGGLSIGSNMMNSVRMLARDAAMAAAGRQQGASNNGGGSNQIGQGRSRAGGGGGRNARSSSRGSAMQQIARNRTLTGMAVTAGALGAAGAARMTMTWARRAVGLGSRRS